MYMYDIIIFQYSTSTVTVSSLRYVSIFSFLLFNLYFTIYPAGHLVNVFLFWQCLSQHSYLHGRLLHIIAIIIIIIIRRVKSSSFYTLNYIVHGEKTKNTKIQRRKTEYI